jgi:hypothetical protein
MSDPVILSEAKNLRLFQRCFALLNMTRQVMQNQDLTRIKGKENHADHGC